MAGFVSLSLVVGFYMSKGLIVETFISTIHNKFTFIHKNLKENQQILD